MFKYLILILALFCFNSEARSHGSSSRGSRTVRGPSRGRSGSYRSHGNGHVGNPTRFHLGSRPNGGWRGNPYYYGGYRYFVWGWEPRAPFWGWPYYYGWHVGLYYYVPEGLKCFADNKDVPGLWSGLESYYSSDDAIDSALGACENDSNVINANAQEICVIRNCERW
jgi:hypothetical protein